MGSSYLGCRVMFLNKSQCGFEVMGGLKTPRRSLAMAMVMAGVVSWSAFADVPESLSASQGAQPVVALTDDVSLTLSSSEMLLAVDVGMDLWDQSGLFGDTIWQDAAFESVLATDTSYQDSLATDLDGRLLLEAATIGLGPPIQTAYEAVAPAPTTASVSAPSGQSAGTSTNTTYRTPWSGRLSVDDSLAPVAVDTPVDEGGYFSISISTAPAPGAVVLALLGLGLVGAFRAADRRS